MAACELVPNCFRANNPDWKRSHKTTQHITVPLIRNDLPANPAIRNICVASKRHRGSCSEARNFPEGNCVTRRSNTNRRRGDAGRIWFEICGVWGFPHTRFGGPDEKTPSRQSQVVLVGSACPAQPRRVAF